MTVTTHRVERDRCPHIRVLVHSKHVEVPAANLFHRHLQEFSLNGHPVTREGKHLHRHPNVARRVCGHTLLQQPYPRHFLRRANGKVRPLTPRLHQGPVKTGQRLQLRRGGREPAFAAAQRVQRWPGRRACDGAAATLHLRAARCVRVHNGAITAAAAAF